MQTKNNLVACLTLLVSALNFNLRGILIPALIVLGLVVTAHPALAQGQAGWDYKASHGMASCEFEARTSTTAAVNGGVVQTASRSVTVNTQNGSVVTLYLFCARSQNWDSAGQLQIGPEVNYSGPNGSGAVVGVDKPSDYVSSGARRPKGRSWTVPGTAGTYTLTGGSDSLSVTIQPIAAPVSQEQFVPVQKMVEEDHEYITHEYTTRVMQITGGYIFHLDSLGKEQDATQGFALDVNALLGPTGDVKFLTGLTFNMAFRQKEILNVPNQPSNGFNRWTGWQTIFIGPKAGVDYMPVSWFNLQAWGSLGALVSIDGTIPESQLPDRTLYTGESATFGALGYKGQLNLNFVLGNHFVVGPAIGFEGNATKLPIARGPAAGTSCTPGGQCLIMQKGHFINAVGAINIGGQF